MDYLISTEKCYTRSLTYVKIYQALQPDPDVMKLEYILKLKIKCNDWLLADKCVQAVNHCVIFYVSTSSHSLCFILSSRIYSSFITSWPGLQCFNI